MLLLLREAFSEFLHLLIQLLLSGLHLETELLLLVVTRDHFDVAEYFYHVVFAVLLDYWVIVVYNQGHLLHLVVEH